VAPSVQPRGTRRSQKFSATPTPPQEMSEDAGRAGVDRVAFNEGRRQPVAGRARQRARSRSAGTPPFLLRSPSLRRPATLRAVGGRGARGCNTSPPSSSPARLRGTPAAQLDSSVLGGEPRHDDPGEGEGFRAQQRALCSAAPARLDLTNDEPPDASTDTPRHHGVPPGLFAGAASLQSRFWDRSRKSAQAARRVDEPSARCCCPLPSSA